MSYKNILFFVNLLFGLAIFIDYFTNDIYLSGLLFIISISISIYYNNIFEKNSKGERKLIKEIDKALSQAENGDFEQRITNIDNTQKLSSTAWALNNLLDQLEALHRDIISSIYAAENGWNRGILTGGYKGNFKKTAIEASKAIESISEKYQIQLKNTLKYELNNIDGNIKYELNNITKDISNSIKNLLSRIKIKSEEIYDKSSLSKQNIAELNQTLNKLIKFIDQSNKSIEILNARNHDIENIINFITEIADQTNILSLNAAIEASKADENSKGFAIVSNEIRNLSEKIQKATAKIDATIKSLQRETLNIQKDAKHITKIVNISKDNVNQLHTILNDFWKTSKENTTLTSLANYKLELDLAKMAHTVYKSNIKEAIIEEKPIKPISYRECDFGKWLYKEETIKALQCKPEFETLLLLHEQIHEVSNKMLECTKYKNCLKKPEKLKQQTEELEAISEKMNMIINKLFTEISKEICL